MSETATEHPGDCREVGLLTLQDLANSGPRSHDENGELRQLLCALDNQVEIFHGLRRQVGFEGMARQNSTGS